jgi:hypothetical protein
VDEHENVHGGPSARTETTWGRRSRRGSALESAAILDVLRLLGVATADGVERCKLVLYRVVAMLTKMCADPGRTRARVRPAVPVLVIVLVHGQSFTFTCT